MSDQSDYTYRGMNAFLENEALRVGILLDKGADIFEFTFSRGSDFMWQSLIELRNRLSPPAPFPKAPSTTHFYGGWQDVPPPRAGQPNHIWRQPGSDGDIRCCPSSQACSKTARKSSRCAPGFARTGPRSSWSER
jgi:hypothetical protein